MDRVLRFWSCDLTGEECCTILRNGEEIAVQQMKDMIYGVRKTVTH